MQHFARYYLIDDVIFSFQVKDRQGLILLMKALKLGLQTQGFQVSSPPFRLSP
jgi:hypothetical protein